MVEELLRGTGLRVWDLDGAGLDEACAVVEVVRVERLDGDSCEGPPEEEGVVDWGCAAEAVGL